MAFVIFMVITILSYIGVLKFRQYAEKHQLFDKPNHRSSHSTPIPLGGGSVIVAFAIVAGLYSIYETGLTSNVIYVICGITIACLGWYDDIYALSAKLRFIVQALIAIVSIVGFGYFESVSIPWFGVLPLGSFGIIITFLWIVGLINAYNFMDGIDGMAGGVAFVGGLGWAILASNVDNLMNSFVFWVALAISASSLGFLGHNWSPAKIFMGDVSSTFLGYSFALLPLITSTQGGDSLMLGTLLMWVVIMDTGLTFLQRWLRGERLFSPHRSHLYQRLIIRGYTHAAISSLYIVLTFVAIWLGFELLNGDQKVAAFIIFGLPLIWVLLSVHASKLENAG